MEPLAIVDNQPLFTNRGPFTTRAHLTLWLDSVTLNVFMPSTVYTSEFAALALATVHPANNRG